MIAIRLLAFCLAATSVCCGQPSTVRWQHSIETVSPHESVLVFKATVMPGWHLYSQHLPEGGPAPTRFSFEPAKDYQINDSTQEQGAAVTFHDDTYDMQITWYSGSVTFRQRVLVAHRPVTVRGRVAYMTCNTQVCRVFEEPFVFVVPQ